MKSNSKYLKGISLIALVITIVVVIILMTAILLTFSEGGLMDSAKKSKFTNDFRSIEEGVDIYSISNIDVSNPSDYVLPIDGKLSLPEKEEIDTNNPTLKMKIEELNPGKSLADVNLYWIAEPDIGANNIPSNKLDKGYIIDADTRQIYDYYGDFFENKRWHTLDGGVVYTGPKAPEVTEELWDGWIKLTLYYPSNSTARQWRLGSEGEVRVDPMLMWQNYTGPITIPIDRVKDVWIKYKIENKEVIIPPAGTLLVDIVPDKTGTTKVTQVRVKINFDETAEVKEYRVGSSGWMTYNGEFTVTENCMIEARAKKKENIYNTDGSLLLTRDISGRDIVYIGNIGINETELEAPTITRLDPQNDSEKARVQVVYPGNAVKKIFKINYGEEQNYNGDISIKDYGTHIIAYYYDASGKRSRATSIYINDTSIGDPSDPSEPYSPYPPYVPGNPVPSDPAIPKDPSTIDPNDPKKTTSLPPPTFERLAAQSGDELARISVKYPGQAVTKIYTVDYGSEQAYTGDISIKTWGTHIIAYYYDAEGNVSTMAWIRVYENSTITDTYDPYEPKTLVPAPSIIVSPNNTQVSEVQVSVDAPAEADKVYIKIGRYGEYQDYTGPITVRENTEIYAYYKTYIGQKSLEANARVTNIRKNESGTSTDKLKPYVYIDATPYPWSGSYGAKEVAITIKYSGADTIEYSEDGIIYTPYTETFKVTTNKRIYARGINANGVTDTYLDITNIGEMKPPVTIKNLAVNIVVDPEPELSTTRYAKAKISIEYDKDAKEKYYRIGAYGTLQTYAGPFEVTSNCTVYAYAKATNAQGQTAKTIDNILNGISEPRIYSTPGKNVQASKVTISIIYDRYAKIKRYSINGGPLIDYTGTIDITSNQTVIYAYNENEKGQKASSTYTVENVVPPPPVLVVDKGAYYLLKLNYPEGSKGREYKWKADGEWKPYKSAGILLIKPQYQSGVIENGTVIKIEDENGKIVDFKGDYYLIDVPISELFENIFMRWDRTIPKAPQIVINPTEPTKEATAAIVYDQTLLKKLYRIIEPNKEPSDWLDYTGPVKITKNNTTIYAKGQDDAEVWSYEAMKKVINIDEVPPVIKLTADLTTAQQKVPVRVYVTDDVAVGKVKWAEGLKGESFFQTSGNEIVNNSIVNITKNGYYTFYGEDKVGNPQIYTLNVTNVDLTPPEITIQANPENEFGINTTVSIDYGDSTIKQYKVGESNTTWSTYTVPFALTSNTVIAKNWQNSDGTVTIFAKGKDKAGNEITVQKKIMNLDLDRPILPVIVSNSSYATLTDYGAMFDAATTIIYDTRTDIDNYYSIDNGATWKPYTGQFDMTNGTIIAKSVKKESGLEVSTSQTIAMPTDALKPQAYDGNDSTYISEINQYMQVHDNMQGKQIRVRWYSVNSTTYLMTIKFLNSNRQQISAVSRGDGTFDDIYTIPANTKWIVYTCPNMYSTYERLYEIQPSNEPTFSATNGYMLLTADPTKAIKEPYQMVSISYFPTSVQRLYRIGTVGDWLNYADQPILVKQGQTIYAKGIDTYGNQTRIISSYTANVPDAMKLEAFDGNDGTYISDINQYMQVDSSMQGKKIRVKWYSVNSTTYLMTIKFLDANKQQISVVTRGDGTFDDLYTVPANTKWIVYSCPNVYTTYERLYEIQPSNEPTFSATNGYMLLTADPTKSIKEPYQMVSISYFPTSVQRQYRIGTTGDWLNYADQPIWVKQGQTVYAKGIDQYGNQTRIISSYTANVPDAMKLEAFDGNEGTYISDINQYVQVDSSMQGRAIRIKWYSTNSTTYLMSIKFLDANKQQIRVVTRGDGTFDDIYTVPANTKWIVYSCPNVNTLYERVYEIQPSNEPTFSTTNGYMLLTADPTKAIKEPYQMVSISYFPTSVKRLYRIGTSGDWINYNDQPIWVKQDQTIYANGIDQYGNQTRIISNYTANVPDAMKLEAFDGNDGTYISDINQYMQVDSSMQGRAIRIKWYSVNSTTYLMSIKFLDANKQQISVVTRGDGTFDDIYTVPANTKWIVYTCPNVYTTYEKLYEIQPSNEPIFSATNGYMLLTADPTKAIKEPYQMVSISYFPTSVQRQYRIGTTGDWLNYTDQPIWVKQGQTIYAKGIDQYGNQTRIISSYTANVPDAMKLEAFDGNDGTYISDINQYMQVDSSMQGKRIRVKWYSVNSTTYLMSIKFLDANKQQISVVTRGDGTFDDIYTVPANTKWIVYSCPNVYTTYERLYEIQPSNEPTFSATNGYMLLTADPTKAIKEPYQMITINYFFTSVQRLYRIGTTGDWISYTDQPIWVKQGQTIYAMGIDQYGNQTRIISSYTANVPDAMKMEAFDGNDGTYISDINQYMQVDSSMQGKRIRIRWYSVNSTTYLMSIKFLDANKQQISVVTRGDGTFDDIYTVPANTKWIVYSCPNVYATYERLYEIQPTT